MNSPLHPPAVLSDDPSGSGPLDGRRTGIESCLLIPFHSRPTVEALTGETNAFFPIEPLCQATATLKRPLSPPHQGFP